MYTRTEPVLDSSASKDKKPSKKKILNLGVNITKRYKPKEPYYDPHAKRFIRKDKTFAPFAMNKMIKLDKIIFTFPKTNMEKKLEEEYESFNEESRFGSQTQIKVVTEEDLGSLAYKGLNSKVRRPKTSLPEERKPRNMHIIDQELKGLTKKPRGSGHRMFGGSSTNLHHLGSITKQPITTKTPKPLPAEDVSSQFSLHVRPFSAKNLFSISKTELSGGSRAGTAAPKKSRQPSASGHLITVEVGNSRVKTADLFAGPEASRQEFTGISRETSLAKPEASRERLLSQKARPKSGFPIFFRQASEKGRIVAFPRSKR
jgi:hypothetical protein